MDVDAALDPLDTPLPCDVTVGACTFRKGVKLRTFVEAARRWHGWGAELMAERTGSVVLPPLPVPDLVIDDDPR